MRSVCDLLASMRKIGGVSTNGALASPGFASALPLSIHTCTSEGSARSLVSLSVTSRFSRGYTTRVPPTVTLAPALPANSAATRPKPHAIRLMDFMIGASP